MVVAMMKSHNCLLLILFARAIPLLVHTSTTVEDTMAEPASTGAGITETGVTTAAPAESTAAPAESTTESTAAAEGFTTAPDGSSAAPGGSTAAPDGSSATPGGSTAAPDGSSAAPGGSTAAPDGSSAAPGGSTAAPDGSTAAPGGSTATPGGSTDAPGGSTDAPGGSTAAPGGSTDAPDGSTAAPGGSTATPGGSTYAPGGSTDAPGGSTDAPGGSTDAPGGSTDAPGGSTAAPGGSTDAPDGSTAAPDGSTAAPDGSTAAPEDSTSMANTSMTGSTSTTSASTNPNSCSSVICQNLGSCYVSSGSPRCSCRSGFTGGVCELIRRRYRITLTANNESGTPLTWDAAIYGDVNNQERLHLGRRLCTETVQAFRRSSNPEIADASHLCRLTGCREGSVLADLEVTVTFPANTTSPASPSEMLAALNEGIAADNSTFGSAPTVDYANPCVTGNLCSRYGTCQNSGIGTYACTCNAGFADSNPALPGTTCTQLCSSSTCSGSNQVCVQLSGSRALCQCSPGYSGTDCSQQQLSPAIIGLIVACCVLFLLALVSLVLYVMLRRRNNRAKKLRRVTVLDGDAYMINEVAKWRAVPSVRPDHSSVYGGWGPQTYPENAAASSVYIRGQEDTSAPPSGRRSRQTDGAGWISGQPAKSLR